MAKKGLTKRQKAARKAAATRKRNKSKKGGRRSVKTQNLGVTVGGAKTAYDILNTPTGYYATNIGTAYVKAVLEGNTRVLKGLMVETVTAARQNALPALAGAAASYGEDIPFVGDLYKDGVKKPINRFLVKFQKRVLKVKRPKWRL